MPTYFSKTKKTIIELHKDSLCEFNLYCYISQGTAIICLSNSNLYLSNVKIGSDTYINTAYKIEILDETIISRSVIIRDNDGHSIIKKGIINKFLPIKVGRHVWICENATILKGVTICDAAIIGFGAIVTKNVDKNSIAVNSFDIKEIQIDDWK